MRRSGILLLLLASLLAPAWTDEAQVRGLVAHIRNGVLDRYRGTGFGRAIRLGDPAKFEDALRWATLHIDPAGCAKRNVQGRVVRGLTRGADLYLRFDPASVPPGDQAEYATTVWHETMHLVEWRNGDSDRSAAFNDRHTYYFEAMVKDVLDPLRELEQKAADPAVPEAELRSRWTQIRRAFERGSGTASGLYAVPDDLAEFERWSGCRVDLGDVAALYRSGACGDRLKSLFDNTFVAAVNLSDLAVAARPRTPADTSTVFDVTAAFTIAGDDPSTKWTGNVAYHNEVKGPGKHYAQTRGDFGPRSLGFQDGSFTLDVPDSAGEGDLSLACRIQAEGGYDQRAQKVPVRWPALGMDLAGPASVNEGDPCTLTGTVTSGAGPFAWQWSAAGQKGTAAGPAATLTAARARPPAVVFTVSLWDRHKLTDPQAAPLTRTVTIPVVPKPPPAPVLPDMQVSVSAPRETAVGRPIHLSASATGGHGSRTFEWTTHVGQVLQKADIDGRVSTPGTHTFTVRVWDQGRYATNPKVVAVQVEVFPELKGSILGPAEAADGERVALGQDVAGGKGPLAFLWTGSTGATSSKEAIEGVVRGKPGEEKLIRLQVKDRLQPPQVLDLTHRIRVKDQGKVEIVSLTVSPAEIEPGKAAQVKMDFVVTGFRDPVVTANTFLGMEASSGSGRGGTSTSSFAVPQGTSWSAWADLPTAPNANPGPIRAVGTVTVGDVTARVQTSARIKRPGGLQDVTVDSRQVEMRLWDHGEQDGDIVTVYLNGQALVSNFPITNAGANFRLMLNPGPNRLVVFAHNEGSSSPNTASISLTRVVRGPASQSYSLNTNASGYFDILAP